MQIASGVVQISEETNVSRSDRSCAIKRLYLTFGFARIAQHPLQEFPAMQ